MATTTPSRIRHAAHYMGGQGGHDLMQWDVSGADDWRPGQPNPTDVGQGAEYAYGYLDKHGFQHWVFTRIAPLSDGTCAACATSRPEAGPTTKGGR